MSPLAVFTLTSPASRPFVSVVIVVWAQTGCTARANPVARLVTTTSRRDIATRPARLRRSASKVFMYILLRVPWRARPALWIPPSDRTNSGRSFLRDPELGTRCPVGRLGLARPTVLDVETQNAERIKRRRLLLSPISRHTLPGLLTGSDL